LTSPPDELLARLPDNAALPDTEGEALLGRLLERLPVGIVSVNERLEIEYANSAAVAYIGGFGDLLPEPWPVFSLRKFAAGLFTDTPARRRVVKTRSGRLLELEGLPAEDGSAVLLLRDVTERARRRRAEREWVANASHELRTPIAAIASAVEVLQGGAKEAPTERDRFLEHIERESRRLSRLAEALLLLARVQTGHGAIALELVDVKPLLEDVVAALDPRDGVDVRVDCSSGRSVLADRDLLRQAVFNVAANAARHTTQGVIEVACREEGAVCEIEVRDTGPGIPELERRRVFERFFRGGGNGRGGFGLGLALTREITRALGGRVELDSSPQGTRVRIQLPAARVVHE